MAQDLDRSDDLAERLARAVSGSPEALVALYDAYADRVYATALRLTGRTPDAEDVVQDVFLGLPRALRTFEGRGAFAGWLRTVTIRTCLMRMRRRRHRREVPLDAASPDSIAVDPRETVRTLAIQSALRDLPETLRLVFVLKVVEGRPHTEIARLLGISVSASRARLSRARATLRSALAEEGS